MFYNLQTHERELELGGAAINVRRVQAKCYLMGLVKAGGQLSSIQQMRMACTEKVSHPESPF